MPVRAATSSSVGRLPAPAPVCPTAHHFLPAPAGSMSGQTLDAGDVQPSHSSSLEWSAPLPPIGRPVGRRASSAATSARSATTTAEAASQPGPQEGTSMFGSRSRRVVVGLAAGLLMATAACSSRAARRTRPEVARPAADSPRMTFAMISHAPEGDAFFDVIKKGAQDAADKDNVEFKYSSSGEVPEPVDVHPERDRQQGRRHRGQPARPRRAGPGDPEGGRGRHPGRRVQRR